MTSNPPSGDEASLLDLRSAFAEFRELAAEQIVALAHRVDQLEEGFGLLHEVVSDTADSGRETSQLLQDLIDRTAEANQKAMDGIAKLAELTARRFAAGD